MARRSLIAFATALLALVFAAVALAVVPNKGRYIGETSQGADVAIKVNDAQRIKLFKIEYGISCDNGGAWTGGTIDRDKPKKHPNDKIKQQQGIFSDEGKHKQKSGNVTGHVKYELEGAFDSPTTASGKFKVKVRVTQGDHTIDHCHKTVQWNVSPL